MTPDSIIEIFSYAALVVVSMISIIIIPGLCVGLAVSIFQAVTQIQEQTLSFVPRLMMTFFILIFAGNTLLQIILEYTEALIHDIPYLIG